MSDVREEILADAVKCLEFIEARLPRLKGRHGGKKTLNAVVRRVHIIRSACGFLGLRRVEALAHACEGLLYRDSALEAGPEAIVLFGRAANQIKTLLAQMVAGSAEPDGNDRALIAELDATALPADTLASISIPGAWPEAKSGARIETFSSDRKFPSVVDLSLHSRRDDHAAGWGLQAMRTTPSRSQLLEAASSDLRQPLQTLALLQGLLAKKLKNKEALRLLARTDEAVLAMSGMLNALLDINQLEAGVVRPEVHDFPVNELLKALTSEFAFHAKAKGLGWRVKPCRSTIRADPRLLGQMIRSLLSNTVKHTRKGALLLGCKQRGEDLQIEVWNSGLRIPTNQLRAVFGEIHEIEKPSREFSRGLGLGLAVVKRLGDLSGVAVDVQSDREQGSVFVLEVPLATSSAPRRPPARTRTDAAKLSVPTGSILIVEDDPDLRESLDLFLRAEGHVTASGANGDEAVRLVNLGLRPDLVVIDYDLSGDQNGLEVMMHLRGMLAHDVPALILTGNVSTDMLHEISRQGYEQRSKPVTAGDLSRLAKRLLSLTDARRGASSGSAERPLEPVVFLIDGDHDARAALGDLLRANGRMVCEYASAEDFLISYHADVDGVLLFDFATPGLNGLALLDRLRDDGYGLPAIMITNNGDVPSAVRAMRAGAADLIEKPVAKSEVLASIDRALERSRNSAQQAISRGQAAARLANLTPRQRLVMEMVLAGQPSKLIAADLGISQRTVEFHRAAIMRRTDSRSIAELVRLAVAAT